MCRSWQFLYRVADFVFSLEGDDPLMEALAASLYRGARTASVRPQMRLRLERRGKRISLWCQGRLLCAADGLQEAFAEAESALTRIIMAGLGHHLQCHAAVVSRTGTAWLLAGPADCGKTTLALALASVGASILTDEVAVVDASGSRVAAFPRDLIIHRGTDHALAGLFTEVPQPAWKQFAGYRYCAHGELGLELPGGQVPLGAVVLPRLQHHGRTRLRPVGQAEAAQRLLEQSFNLDRQGARGMGTLAALVQRTRTVSLAYSDARDAALQLVAALRTSAPYP